MRNWMMAAVVGTVLAVRVPALAADDHEHHDHDHAHEEQDDGGHADEPENHDDDHADHEDEHDDAGGAFTVADFERSGVRLATAGPGEIDIGVELPGEVRPNGDRIAHLSPRFPGIVREVRKQIGDRVRAGEVLAIIESESLSPFELKAAFDGTIIDKHISPGETVTRDDTAFIVADLSTVWVTIAIYQSALSQVAVGQPVALAAGHGTLEATGTVAYITPVVDQATRTASARVVLPNPDGAWRPGLFVTATVYGPRPAAVAVPRQAIQTVERRPVVFVAVGDRFEARPVTIGHTGRTRVEITRGLVAGERFAAERSFLVKAELAKGEAGHDHGH
jgi:cobalt-zinc-cadmium efflux system membrane fusion protein